MTISVPYAVSVWKRNAAMYARTWKLNLLPNFFEPVFYLMAIGIGVGAYIDQMGGVSYVEFLAPGLICVAAMNGASFEVTYNIYVRMSFENVYEAMLTTPVQPVDVLAGEILWAVTRATIYGGIFYLVVALNGLAPMPTSLLALLVVPLTGLLFAMIGVTFTLSVPTMDFFSFYFTLFLTPLFLFSDVFFPIQERLDGGWLWVAEALPLLHPVRLSRSCFSGELGPLALWDLAYILVLSGGLFVWARRRISERLGS